MLRKEKSEEKFGLLEIICLGFDDYKKKRKVGDTSYTWYLTA
jgi:hypothetical protein